MYRVLIADDDPLMRKALKVMISQLDNFEVVYSVGCGEQAVEICKDKKIDIVFMDIMMPGESGIESSKKIYLINPKIAIFIISSYNNFNFAIGALNTKVKSYISKPVSFSKIEEILNNFKNDIYEERAAEKNENEIERIFSIIRDKDFRRVYYEISEIVEGIYFSINENSKCAKEYFLELGQHIIDNVELLSRNSQDINKLFPINEFSINDKKYYELWLFKVINYIFQNISIKKYKLLENVFKYIEDHIEEEIGLNEIINECSVSQGYLSRIFKKQFNISVMEYLHMRKIYLAKTYFSFSDLSTTDVAFKLGYNESSYFGKVFKKYEKITVHKYKKCLKSLE